MISFPRWIASLAGALLGAIFAAFNEASRSEPRWIGPGVALGAISGGLIYLLDTTDMERIACPLQASPFSHRIRACLDGGASVQHGHVN